MAKENGLAKLGGDVPTILSALENELKELKKVSGSNFRSSGVIGSWDLKKETSIETMGKKFASLLVSKDSYDRAMAELGVTTYPVFNVGGATIEDWKKDFQLRMAIVTQAEREKALKEAIAEMKTFLTEEDRKTQAMAKIAGILGL